MRVSRSHKYVIQKTQAIKSVCFNSINCYVDIIARGGLATKSLSNGYKSIMQPKNRVFKIKGLPVRDPYPIEYMGHNTLITLEEVLKHDSVKVIRIRKAKADDAGTDADSAVAES